MNDSAGIANTPSSAVVIATRNRPEPLRVCLETLSAQTLKPGKVIVVDSSDNRASADMIDAIHPHLGFPMDYQHTVSSSAARQRNVGAQKANADVIVFLDDDVELEEVFLFELMSVFRSDFDGRVGAISGTISNQVYSDPRGLNRFLLGFCLGQWRGSYAGRLLGPAVNFLPADTPDTVQHVEWLPSTCTAYRRDVFMAYRFCDDFEGYSFAEDVHLSSRVHQTHQLLTSTRARVFHRDLGKSTHTNWVLLGESMVINRHRIMVALHRNNLTNHVRLFAYEMLYSSAAWLAAGVTSARLAILAKLVRGRLSGFAKVWFGPLPRPVTKDRVQPN